MISAKKRKFGKFWPDRAEFYRDLAESLQEKELLRDFIQGEIDSGEKGSPRLRALMHMRRMMNAGEIDIVTLLEAVMPDTDRLALTVLRTAPDTPLVLIDSTNLSDWRNHHICWSDCIWDSARLRAIGPARNMGRAGLVHSCFCKHAS